ncbi:MAG: Xaa-Pro dipeptidyl-peptidase [Streptococcaceae bacterium]|jgi:X-Pro dipeptidyl-peptidase|nr:Xaa-Pro dipeptidyl-peptidase [Streptococcaceae bacterium]
MVKFNHFSIVEKTFEEKLAELDSLGFHLSGLSEKEILKEFLIVSPVDMTGLAASRTSNLIEFLKSDKALNWDIFWTIALQLQGFLVAFDFELDKAEKFAQSVNSPHLDGVDSQMSAENLISALYLLLASRRKNGMTLLDYWVSEGLLPVDNAHHFFNDKSLATFDTTTIKREKIWVESSLDTQKRGQYDLIYVEVHRPVFSGKLPVVMTASPYHMGMNDLAADKKLHKMEGQLDEKSVQQISTTARLPEDPAYEKKSTKTSVNNEADYTFTHSWTYSLNDYFLARGFASIYVGGVGTMDSDGFQTSGDYQQIYSMKAVIDWLNGRARAFTSRNKDKEIKVDWANGKVAMTGQSYLGTMSYGLATTGVDGLEVILAQAGISSWYNYYREGGLVRSPGGFPGEDLDTLAELTYSRNMSGSDFLSGNAKYQEQLEEMTRALDRKSGDYNQFWEDRNYLPNVKNVKADVLILHGLQDFNVTPDQAYNYWKALPETVAKHAFLHRGAHLPIHNWQSIDFTEIINTYFTAKLLNRDLNLALPKVVLQENNKYEAWTALEDWGTNAQLQHSLGTGISRFENHYDDATFSKYSTSFETFKQELYQGKTQATVIDLDIPQELKINGVPELEIKLKINDTKGLLSAQLLDLGNKKRLVDRPSVLEANALDRGRLFKQENLLELPLQVSQYQVISKGFLNLQNREDLLQVQTVLENEWMTFRLKLWPTIYKLEADDKVRILLYSTDFEHTVRDNRDVSYEIDLAASRIILPY